jgi:hypothetical protein
MDDPLATLHDVTVAQKEAHEEIGEVERLIPQEVESTLASKVGAMVMDPGHGAQVCTDLVGKDASIPIVQFPDEDGQGDETERTPQVHVEMTADMLAHMQRMHARHNSMVGGSNWERGPRPSDMIPALQGLSSLQVSFGSVNDVSMTPADTILGKRGAEEQEVQGGRLELSLGLDYGGTKAGGTPKKGKTQGADQGQPETRNIDMFYRRNRKGAATGHTPTGKLTRPNVWSRQEQ